MTTHRTKGLPRQGEHLAGSVPVEELLVRPCSFYADADVELRALADADRLRDQLHDAATAVVVGSLGELERSA